MKNKKVAKLLTGLNIIYFTTTSQLKACYVVNMSSQNLCFNIWKDWNNMIIDGSFYESEIFKS